MKALIYSALIAGTLALSSVALAGEVNGSQTNPKEDFSKGVSICLFSGLNDGEPPAGKTQSFGQDVANDRADPQEFNPGDEGGCNAHLSPWREPGNPNEE
jgi:uncharacterized low-complexity protein